VSSRSNDVKEILSNIAPTVKAHTFAIDEPAGGADVHPGTCPTMFRVEINN
jgi:hypothetical protein